jgi:hypothetical protein
MPLEIGTAVVDLSKTLSLAELGSDEPEDGPAETKEAEAGEAEGIPRSPRVSSRACPFGSCF